MKEDDPLRGTTTSDIEEWQNSLTLPLTCDEIVLEIKSETAHFLTLMCTSPKGHQGDCIINLNWGDTEIEIKKKRGKT